MANEDFQKALTECDAIFKRMGLKPPPASSPYWDVLAASGPATFSEEQVADYMAYAKSCEVIADLGWAVVVSGIGPGRERFIAVNACDGTATLITDLGVLDLDMLPPVL